MDELYQAEWCPYSSRVRQRLTELGVPFVARQVPPDRADRDDLRRRAGTDEIPVLVFADGTMAAGEADEIVALLNDRYPEGDHAERHRERAREHGVELP